jgi:glycosyltransferase involved in cell wall biosynthesis
MIVVALPAFNEEVAVGSVVLKAQNHVDKVVVIDDGSSDATAEVARLAGAEVISHDVNKGKGAAISSAFKRAREMDVDVLVLLDCDGQHDPGEIPGLLDPIKSNEADIVIGSRFLNGDHKVPKYRRVGQEVLSKTTNIASGHSLTDTQSGYRAFNKKALHALSFSENGIGIESEMQLQAKDTDLRIVEVPISCSYAGKTSSQGPIGHTLEVLASIVRFISQRHPLSFFGIPGIFLVLFGVYQGTVVLYKFNQSNLLPTGTALLTAIFILAGILSLFTGIILYNIGTQISRLKGE